MTPVFGTQITPERWQYEHSFSPWAWNDKRSIRLLNDRRYSCYMLPFFTLSENELASLLCNIQKKGKLKESLFYIWDEPAYMEDYEQIKRKVNIIRKYASDARIYSFWVNVIGKGYPVPNTAFRWCTEKMKIKPTARFIIEQVDECGEAIILIGTRKAESATRARSIKKHEIHGKRLTNHTLLANTYVYAPIKELLLEEVWYIINTIPSPWGFDNKILFNIYLDASADDYECPTVVTDKSHGSCGQSRFGCWTCTVVKDDKSMRSLIKNGREWMQPLYDFRLKLDQERNIIENRFPLRRDGRKAVNDMGPYTFTYRAQLLEGLLNIQHELQQHTPEIKLISDQELIAIQVNWYRDFNFAHQVSEIYNKIYNSSLNMEEGKMKNKLEADLMREICQENIEEGELIEQLLMLQKSKSLMQRRRGLKTEIESRLEEFVNKKKS